MLLRQGVHRRGSSWFVQWDDARGFRQSQACATRAVADQVWDSMQFATVMTAHVAAMKGTQSAWARTQRDGRLWTALFDGLTIHELRPETLEAWITERLQAGASPGTIRRSMNTLTRVVNQLVRDGRLDRSPFLRVGRPRYDGTRRRYCSDVEEATLLSHLNGLLRVLFILAIYTGLRRGELLGLRWEFISFERLEICLPMTKNGAGRCIPLHEDLAPIIQRLPSSGQSPWLFPSTTERRAGLPIGPYLTEIAWKRILRLADVGGLRWHDLRHSYASRLIMAGADIRTVQELLGHRSIQQTQRYTHLTQSHLRDAVHRLRPPKM